MRAVPWPEPDPVVAAAIRAKYAGRRVPLAVAVRDRLGQWMADEAFAAAFGVRGRPGQPPSRLAVVTVLQMMEDLGGRQAAEAVRTRLDWQYLLGLGLGDAGFDHSVLGEFRGRVAGHELEEAVLDALLAKLAADGLIRAGGKQRTDSAQVIAAVRALHTTGGAGGGVPGLARGPVLPERLGAPLRRPGQYLAADVPGQGGAGPARRGIRPGRVCAGRGVR